MLLDFYDLFERYAIMTEQSDVTKLQALAYLKPKTTKQLYEKLLKEINK